MHISPTGIDADCTRSEKALWSLGDPISSLCLREADWVTQTKGDEPEAIK
jgi:hypothetical protein